MPDETSKPASLPLWRLIVWIALTAIGLTFHLIYVDETFGHSEDLLPQWTLARLAVTGHRADSYNFAMQDELVRAEVPPHKWISLFSPHMKGIGVSPYPPPMIVLYAPHGMVSYDTAAQIVYVATIVLALIAAAAIHGATRGGISGFAAAAAILFYPGFLYNLMLGQNAMLTLALLALGWCGLARGWDTAAGIAWGLLVYKPHWFVAIVWLPILLRRWRTVAMMSSVAAILCAAATYWLGPEAWNRWLSQVRALDAVTYTDPEFRGWILGMACDLRGVVNRYMPGSDLARPLGWAALGVVGLITIAATARAWRRPAPNLDAEPAAPAWLATSFLVVPYLYYYDECILLLPLLIAWSLRSMLARWQLGLLALVTMGYYVALPVMIHRDPGPDSPAIVVVNDLPAWTQARPVGWLGGPNWALAVALALWMLSLTFRDASQKRSE